MTYVTARRADTAPKENDPATIMLEEDLYLAVPVHSPYGSRESIRLTDTKDADYICLGGSKPIRQITNSYFMEAGFTPHIIFESDTYRICAKPDRSGNGHRFLAPPPPGGLLPGILAVLPDIFR